MNNERKKIMRKIIFRQTLRSVYVLAIVTMFLSSCREESDLQTSYGNNDLAVMMNVKDFASSFKALWEGINNGYPLWDYEQEMGVDWDAVYEEFYPQFAALDGLEKVSDDEVRRLLYASFGQLHDGHFALKMKNFSTGNLVPCSPQSERIKQRDDYEITQLINSTTVKPYLSATGDNKVVSYDETNNSFSSFISENFLKCYQYDSLKLDSLKGVTPRTSEVSYQIIRHEMLLKDLKTLMAGKQMSVFVYNAVVSSYADLKNPYLKDYDTAMLDAQLSIKYARFQDGIVYLSLNSFSLSPFLDDLEYMKRFTSGSASSRIASENIKRVYNKWFDDIQTLKKSGKLKGVVIDLRGNGGGLVSDNQYIMGALLPAGDYELSQSRYKRGVGRLDFSPLFPLCAKTSEIEHEVIDQEPVVVLTNCSTVSMAESSALQAKKMSNGRVIGKRSWGGTGMLIDDVQRNLYNLNYSGTFGNETEGPIYAYVPILANFTDYGILESKGIEPDIDVDLDLKLYVNEKRDSQLERALQYIRTGN